MRPACPDWQHEEQSVTETTHIYTDSGGRHAQADTYESTLLLTSMLGVAATVPLFS